MHFYWIGAVPAMVFLGLVMMPFYYGSRVRSVPEFLLRRFNPATHLFNALTFAAAAVLIAGVNLYALALVIKALIGWPIWLSIVVSARFVLAYITLGGLSGAIYNEVLQFFVIIAGLVPLVIIGLHDVGGWSGLQDKIDHTKLGSAAFSTWGGTHVGHWTNPLGDWIGIVMGLGFVLSFGYWTTNFAEVQRALSAKDLSAAQRTPLIGAFPKIFIPALTIIPGLIALAVIPNLGTSDKATYNDAIPLLMNKYLPNGTLGIALAGLLAAFMAGMAANVSSFNTVFTYDIWQTYIVEGPSRPLLPEGRPDRHRGRHPDRHRHGVHRLRLQQHHELHPVAVLASSTRRCSRRSSSRCSGSGARRGPASPGLAAGTPAPRSCTSPATTSPTSTPTACSIRAMSTINAQMVNFYGAIAAFVADAVVTVHRHPGDQAEAGRASWPVWSGACPTRTRPTRPRCPSRTGGSRPSCSAASRLVIVLVLSIIFA